MVKQRWLVIPILVAVVTMAACGSVVDGRAVSGSKIAPVKSPNKVPMPTPAGQISAKPSAIPSGPSATGKGSPTPAGKPSPSQQPPVSKTVVVTSTAVVSNTAAPPTVVVTTTAPAPPPPAPPPPAPPPPANKDTTADAFVTPSGNILCLLPHSGDYSVQCVIYEYTFSPLNAERACSVVFSVDNKGTSTRRDICADGGDPENLLKAQYGDVITKLGFTCTVRKNGVECNGPAGGGFRVSRAVAETW